MIYFFFKKTVVIMRELCFVQVIPERRLRDPLSVAIPGGERGSHGLAPVGVAQHGADNGALLGKKKMRTKEEHIKWKEK